MAKKTKNIDLLFWELYAYSEIGCKTWFGFPIRKGSSINDVYEFLTEDGIKNGEAQYCTRIWDLPTIEKYKYLLNEAQGK